MAAGALLSVGLHPASAISYTYGNATGNFSTGFSPLFPNGAAGGDAQAELALTGTISGAGHTYTGTTTVSAGHWPWAQPTP